MRFSCAGASQCRISPSYGSAPASASSHRSGLPASEIRIHYIRINILKSIVKLATRTIKYSPTGKSGLWHVSGAVGDLRYRMNQVKDLRERTIRAGFTRICAQGASFLIRIGSFMVLARLLDPKDFGLVSMVTAITGVLGLFRDFGLSSAAVQRATVTEQQTSTLFWINLLLGGILTIVALALAPAVGFFYHEPRLLWITSCLALGFLFSGAGVQHAALLQREMRFSALALIDISSLAIGTSIAIGLAWSGYGYWALVAMAVSVPLTTTLGLWLVAAWIPGLPRRGIGIRSMMRFGGTMTLNGLIMYVANNFDKVLLGRYWGADAIGLYYSASQLIRIPTDNLNAAVGDVAFSALSRLQDDPERLRRYFLKGYSLVVALTLPVTVVCAVFANDLIAVLLGPRWPGAAEIFRILAPTILVFAIINPLGWVLNSLGLVGRGLKIALVFGPLLIISYVIGLPHGPKGVALAYSTVMTLGAVPLTVWALHGTAIRVRDIGLTLSRPLASSAVAAIIAFGIKVFCDQALSLPPRLALEMFAFGITYLVMLLLVLGQKSFYVDMVRGVRSGVTPFGQPGR
jgi:O-antigen/teichoic acid export membrane protein